MATSRDDRGYFLVILKKLLSNSLYNLISLNMIEQIIRNNDLISSRRLVEEHNDDVSKYKNVAA